MCGIYGSTCYNRFKTLYTLNTSRGNFANGHVFVNDSQGIRTLHISKSPGIKKYPDTADSDNKMHLGHTQSPTGSVRDYHPSTTHPFESRNWIVGHNGVINNFEKLKQQHVPHSKCNVDTSIIPGLLEMYIASRHTEQEIADIVKKVLNMISGTYGLFIFNKKYNLLYVARSGSTLFYDPNDGSFSSTQYDNMIDLPEHTLFKVNGNIYERVASLNNNSSFLIL
jgi:glucosamine 6-phosphate synthetase-like amidotransferase/phosphosugar isomerase protein